MSKIWWLFFLCFLEFRALSQDIDRSQWIMIDCGGTRPFTSTTAVLWHTDEAYIKTGTNQNIILNPYPYVFDALKTLRSFPNQNKNCYSLPTSAGRYFFGAGFLYGNYDLLDRPPTFDLEINGNKWDTVQTSSTSAVYHEVIFTSKKGNTEICLVRTKDDEIPFISILEAWPINDPRMYRYMSSDVAWITTYRYNYGATYTIFGYNYVSTDLNIIDSYNRIWNPPDQSVPDVTTVSSYTPLVTTTYEYPPDYAILDAITSDNLTKPIILSFDLKKSNSLNYIEVYFTEVEKLTSNQVRSIDFYIDGDYQRTIIPQFASCSGAIAVISSNKTILTVELRSAKNSTLPPIVSAIEVYTASDPLISATAGNRDHKSKTTTIIVLSVVIPLAILIIIALLYFFIRRRKKSKPGQIGPLAENDANVISTDLDAGPLIETLSPGSSSILNNNVALSHGTNSNLAYNGNGGHHDEESMVPDMDMDEFDEMVNQQGLSGSTTANTGSLTVVVTPSNSTTLSTGNNGVVSHVDVVIAEDLSMVPDIDMNELDQMLNRKENAGSGRKP